MRAVTENYKNSNDKGIHANTYYTHRTLANETKMSQHQNDTISEYHIATGGLNTNAITAAATVAATDDNNSTAITATTSVTSAVAAAIATNTINDDNADRSDTNLSNDCDKPDYLNIDCDRNLNIRCVGMDFEVNKFYASPFFLTLATPSISSRSDCCCCRFLHNPSVVVFVVIVVAAASGSNFSFSVSNAVRFISFPFSMQNRFGC